MNELHNPECFANHMGIWAIEPGFLNHSVSAITAGLWNAQKPKAAAVASDGRPYAVTEGGQAIIPLSGPLMKGSSKYGGSSTVLARRKIRTAVRDPEVKSIMIHIDSPGGHVAGTSDFAEDIAAADKQKPVYAHISDLGASAAYWVASQARRITANKTAQVAGIGTVSVVHDLSGKAEAEGVKVHVVSTGKYKGAFAPGAPVPEEHIQALQERIDGLNEHFLAAVAEGRQLSIEQVRNLADGRVHIAATAKALGLIDEISSFEDALQYAQKHNQEGVPLMSDKTDAPAEALTLESFAANHPEIAAQIRAEGVEEGAKLERERIQAVADQAVPGFEEIVSAAMYDGKSTAADVALQIVAKAKEGNGAALADIAADAEAPIADDGESVEKAIDAKEKAADEELPFDERVKAEWDASPAIRNEFDSDFDTYKSFRQAQDSGKARVFVPGKKSN